MILGKRMHDRSFLIRIAMACLLLALFSQWFLHPTANFGEGVMDGTRGLLFGLSIAFNLLALRRA